jgi:hypothetical protein
MAYKDNLLKKIEIDRLSLSIAKSIGPVDSGKRIDKTVMKQLIAYFPWTRKEARDLELYLETDQPAAKTKILVLDNDLPIYQTTLQDVVLRKSPTVKEMLSIRNAVKILNDKDVLLSKKEASLKTIRDICVGELDLQFSAADIDSMAGEGTASLENGYGEGVCENLMLLAELLGFVPAPAAFALKHHESYGKLQQRPDGASTFGPLVIYSRVLNTLTYLDTVLGSRDKERFARLAAVASGEAEAAASGAAVFELMKTKVLAAAPEAASTGARSNG